MKKVPDPLDDYFRESLEDYRLTPPGERREAALREAVEALETARSRRRMFYFLYLPILLLVLGGALTGLYFITGNGHTPTPEHPQTGATGSTGKAEATGKAAAAVEPGQKQIPGRHPEKIRSAKSIYAFLKPVPSSPSETSPPAIHAQPGVSSREEATDTSVHRSPESSAAATLAKPESERVAEKRDTLPPAGITQTSSDTLVIPSEAGKRRKAGDYRWNFSTGIQYTPEMMFNLVGDDYKFSNNFGLEAVVAFERFSVRTGLGLSVTKGSNETATGYEEYLGSYAALDSITFSYSPVTYEYQPTIYTSPKDVFDTTVKYYYSRIEKRYTYLQVPLILGYDFYSRGKLKIGMRAGPILSLLLSTHQLTASYDPGKDRIVQENRITPDRISTNWMLAGGIDISVSLSRTVSLEIEPEARYYFNSVYEKSDLTTKPWSIGLRAALMFNLRK
jgi:hypothetical protein